MREAVSSGDRLFSFSVSFLMSSRSDILFGGHWEVCGSDLDDRPTGLRLCPFRVLALLRLFLRFRRRCRLLRPDAIDAPTISGDSAIVAEENAARFEGFIGPGVIAETVSTIGGARDDHDLLAVLRVAPAIIKDHG